MTVALHIADRGYLVVANEKRFAFDTTVAAIARLEELARAEKPPADFKMPKVKQRKDESYKDAFHRVFTEKFLEILESSGVLTASKYVSNSTPVVEFRALDEGYMVTNRDKRNQYERHEHVFGDLGLGAAVALLIDLAKKAMK